MEQNTNSKVVFISWQPYCSRSDNFAREFGGKSYKIYFDVFGSSYKTIFFKYVCQCFKTFLILLRERPKIVFVMSPPVFACIPVFLYCFLLKNKYIIDGHTGAFVDRMWRNVKFLQNFFSSHALFTILTNEEIANDLRKWGCDYKIVPDVPISVKETIKPNLSSRYNITLVNTFAKDEPLSNFIEAAQSFQEIDFYITGKIDKNNGNISKGRSGNIIFTDFLSNSEYYGLLYSSDIIVVLTTRDRTMQRGAYEAVYLSKPVITSNWPVLRENFPIGTTFVDNSVEGITAGIDKAIINLDRLIGEVKDLKKLKTERWKKKYSEISTKINAIQNKPK